MKKRKPSVDKEGNIVLSLKKERVLVYLRAFLPGKEAEEPLNSYSIAQRMLHLLLHHTL